MRKLLALSIALLTAFASHADIKIETCIEDHVPNTNCYKVQVTVINDDAQQGRVLIAQGSSWIGSDCEKNGHHEIPNRHPDCPAVALGQGMDLYSTSENCLSDAIDDELKQAILASINDLLSVSVNAAKGLTPLQPAPLAVFPNPAHGYITVATHFEHASSGNMYIVDATGKEVSVTQIQNPGGSRFTLSLKGITPGNYNIIIRSKGRTLGSQKITIL
jgi:hypothetical protein